MDIPFELIDDVVRDEDIESLVQHGAPADEYSSEAKSIMIAMKRMGEAQATEERVALLIRDIWKSAFGPFSDHDLELRMPAFRNIAHRLIG